MATTPPLSASGIIRETTYVADLRCEFIFASEVTERAIAAFEKQDIETPNGPPITGTVG